MHERNRETREREKGRLNGDNRETEPQKRVLKEHNRQRKKEQREKQRERVGKGGKRRKWPECLPCFYHIR